MRLSREKSSQRMMTPTYVQHVAGGLWLWTLKLTNNQIMMVAYAEDYVLGWPGS
jgi:hypothetical protein